MSRRILMVAHGRRLGGIERHVVALADALRRAGDSVAFAGPADGWLGRTMREAGHDCVDLPLRGMYDVQSRWKLRRFARAWRADLLHGHAQRGARYAVWAASRTCPAIITAHSTNSWRWFPRDRPVIAVSQAVRAFLIERGLSADLVRLVHLGVADHGLAEVRDAGPTTAARPLVAGMLARLEQVKGHDIALEAAARLRDQLPLRLVFIGPDGTPWARQMKDAVTRRGLQDVVEFWGRRDDIGAVFDQMDVMLAPSRREALCLSVIEAAAAGRPAIGARIGGIPEVIDDGRSGILTDREDAAGLAEAMLRIGQDGTLRQQMGAAARQFYEAHFTEGAMVGKTQAVYDAALNARGGT